MRARSPGDYYPATRPDSGPILRCYFIFQNKGRARAYERANERPASACRLASFRVCTRITIPVTSRYRSADTMVSRALLRFAGEFHVALYTRKRRLSLSLSFCPFLSAQRARVKAFGEFANGAGRNDHCARSSLYPCLPACLPLAGSSNSAAAAARRELARLKQLNLS